MPARKDLANAIRILSIDAIQKANSGHPGAPMGLADIAEVLWNSHMKYNPANPHWYDRDRFVLSNGHSSMLLYSLLHLTGYKVSIDDIKNFRQLNSNTPGHPEYGCTIGVETTTGPLGQGIANAIGMAIAEKMLAAQFNKPDYDIINHHTYVFLGDGCLMEGISHEVAAIAGLFNLGKLIVFWDNNNISIDGTIDNWMEKSVSGRFESYGWQVIKDIDGHNADEVNQAIIRAKNNQNQPTIICCKTIIGYGANNAGTHHYHGAPLSAKEVDNTRNNLNWKYPAFEIPQSIYKGFNHLAEGKKVEQIWQTKFDNYTKKYPAQAKEFKRRITGQIPTKTIDELNQLIKTTQQEKPTIASRKASQRAIEVIAQSMPELFGGSADLTESNCSSWANAVKLNDCIKDNKNLAQANYVSWGVREFGMAHMMNGISLHGGFRVYGATFLMFMEFMRNALRMSAMMNLGIIYVYTHDSIGVGEDGPTHQPVEQLAAMRVIPNFETWRAADAVESIVAWQQALLRNNQPTALIFSRQNLITQERTAEQIVNISKGGYVLKNCKGKPDLIIIATGSEVNLAVIASTKINAKIRVVSMPSTCRFDKQEKHYKDSVLVPGVKRLIIEASIDNGWYKYAGFDGIVFGMQGFGKSAPAEQLFKEFGFSVDNIITIAKSIL